MGKGGGEAERAPDPGRLLDPLDDRGKERAEDSRGQPRLRAALNQVFLMGNLTRDPELRYTPRAPRWPGWAWR